MTRFVCDSCDFTTTNDDVGSGEPDAMEFVENMAERLDPGSIVPAGQCPKCGALCYIEDDATPADGNEHVVFGDFQIEVSRWLVEAFGSEVAADKLERGDRFLEEALELLQSGGYPRERIHALIDYVYGRPPGDPPQEVGGVMVTLAAYCFAHGMHVGLAAEEELRRIVQPEAMAKIRAKQASKPTGSALPVAAGVSEAEAKEALRQLNVLHHLGDAIYDVRSRVSEEPWPEGVSSSWDHPKVVAYSQYVEVLGRWMEQP